MHGNSDDTISLSQVLIMNFGEKNVYLRVFVKNPRSKETLKSQVSNLKKKHCLKQNIKDLPQRKNKKSLRNFSIKYPNVSQIIQLSFIYFLSLLFYNYFN